jgi:alpha-galactosidase
MLLLSRGVASRFALQASFVGGLMLVAAPSAVGQTFADGKASAGGPAPVQVYILAGQSNMVGIGQVNGGGSRWGDEFVDPVLSVYEGSYDPAVDYAVQAAKRTIPLQAFGGVRPTPYPGGGVQIVRGTLSVKTSGLYELRPGYGDSTYNVMTVGGVEVYRKEPGGTAKHTHVPLEAGAPVPFEIVYLNDRADGLGWIARVDIPGTLTTLVKREGQYPQLLTADGEWRVRDDVYYRGVVTATADQWLQPGCGAGRNNIGPELGFGHVVGDHHDAPVLLLKASQGNRSLGWDFLPPGSERFVEGGKVYAGYKDSPASWDEGSEPAPINWYAGKQYDDCFSAAKALLADWDRSFPQFAGRDHEIAGFVWWQGHKDQGSAVHAARYEQNLVQLIDTLRAEFEAPAAPFVVATIGFGGWEMDGLAKVVAAAQLAVSGDAGNYPRYVGNVKTVETRGFWREAAVSPRNQGFHYHQNAGVYMDVGTALGQGMLELLGKE